MSARDEAPRPRHGRRAAGRGAAARVVAVLTGLALGVAGGLWVTTRTGGQPETAVADALSVGERDGAVSRDERPPAQPSSAPAQPSPTPSPALPPGLSAQDVADGLLAAEVPEVGPGTFRVAPGSDPGPGTGTVRLVRVEVEDGIAVDPAVFAAVVMATLNDPRGWGGDGSLSFARTDGEAPLRVLLATPATVDALCAPLRTAGEVSCGREGRAVLNLRRWVLAVDEYGADRHLYRQYLVNHEVGHLLGHRHEQCGGAGQPAPVMQQQSYAVAPCTPNAWPSP